MMEYMVRLQKLLEEPVGDVQGCPGPLVADRIYLSACVAARLLLCSLEADIDPWKNYGAPLLVARFPVLWSY